MNHYLVRIKVTVDKDRELAKRLVSLLPTTITKEAYKMEAYRGNIFFEVTCALSEAIVYYQALLDLSSKIGEPIRVTMGNR